MERELLAACLHLRAALCCPWFDTRRGVFWEDWLWVGVARRLISRAQLWNFCCLLSGVETCWWHALGRPRFEPPEGP